MNWFRTATFIWTLVVACFLSLCLYTMTLPNYTLGTGRFANRDTWFTAPKLNFSVASKTCAFNFSMFAAPLHVSKFKFYGADQVSLMTVNGRAVEAFASFKPGQAKLAPARAKPFSQTTDLGPYLHTGTNVFHVESTLEHEWVTFYMRPDVRDPFVLSVIGISVFLILVSTWRFSVTFPAWKPTSLEVSVLLFGSVLRLVYSLGVPFFLFAHDPEFGHIPYVEYIRDHWSLPTSLKHTLEFYQPPAYYFLCALVTAIPKALGVCINNQIEGWQALSCLLTIIILAVCVVISRMLFSRDEGWQRFFFLIWTAVFPAFIFNSSCVNNDVLLGLVSVVWLVLLLSVWRRLNLKKWLAISAVLGFGMLTKSNTLPLIISTFCVLLVTRQVSPRSKIALSAICAAVILLLSGWFHLPRVFSAKSPVNLMVSNLDSIKEDISIKENFATMATFNPIAVIKSPFSSQSVADPRRDYFLEYFFRSAFTNENFFFGNDPSLGTARAIVISALLLFPAWIYGFISSLRDFKSVGFPLALVSAVVACCHAAFVLQAPLMCCQNFRYSVILVIPLTYFCIRGLSRLPRFLKLMGLLSFAVLVISSVFIEFAVIGK